MSTQENKQFVQVLLPTGVGQAFQYAVPSGISVKTGDIVEVPFRTKSSIGVVWSDTPDASFKGKAKEIVRKIDGASLSNEMMELVSWVATYTLSPIGNVLRMCLSAPDAFQQTNTPKSKVLEIGQPKLNLDELELSQDQEVAANHVIDSIRANEFKTFLLDGVTGSGKTEVYFKAIQKALDQGRQTLVMLPEIALTSQWLHRFKQRFGCEPQVWHSNLTKSVRRQTWQAVFEGKASVVVGARSSLFLPFKKLGLIIIDEEHDATYKQDEQVLYHARDMAVVRAKLFKVPVVLASATPSLETLMNAREGRYEHLHLRSRHGGAQLPDIKIVDMRQHDQCWIAPPLRRAIETRLAEGQQSMIFLNRRGYAPLTLCRGCGHRFVCPGCTSWLVEHKRTNRLHCHHCGYQQGMPKSCPECEAEDTFVPCGPGVERIQEDLEQLFPDARQVLLTSDTMATPKQVEELLGKISNQEADIIVGTQILAKGYHFPKITLVGVIDADLGLSGGDLRACERTYQLLHQVSGRAGREKIPGEVYLQTFNPDHPVIQALKAQERDVLMSTEAQERQLRQMPPYGRLIGLVISSLQADKVEAVAKYLVKAAPQHPEIMILGPVPAPLAQLRGRHRWRILLKSPKSIRLQKYVDNWLNKVDIPSNVRLSVDVDPYHFL